MQLTVNSTVIASVQHEAIQLRSLLGAFELSVSFRGTVHAKRDHDCRCLTISGARLTLRTKDGRALELGFASSDKLIVLRQHDHARDEVFSLRLLLQPHQIDLVECAREGGDLILGVRLCARGSDNRNPWLDWDEQGDLGFNVTAPESTWVKEMNSSGADRILLFEVRVPFDDGVVPHPAVRHLLRAQQHLLGGNWRECVSECRQFAEDLGGTNLTPATDRLANNRRSMTKDEREAVLLAALLHYGHLAAHSESKHGELDFERADAKLALSLASSLAGHHFRRD
jgi:hypothetical protein